MPTTETETTAKMPFTWWGKKGIITGNRRR
jgi:hypothetical protein